jgi:hypothetical protein
MDSSGSWSGSVICVCLRRVSVHALFVHLVFIEYWVSDTFLRRSGSVASGAVLFVTLSSVQWIAPSPVFG